MTSTPLVVTGDDVLAGDLLRLAAAAGVSLDVVRDPGTALTSWAAAPLVLVGTDAAAELAARVPARRPGVHVVGEGPAPDEVFRSAVVLGAHDVLELPAAEAWLVETLTDVGDGASSRGRTVAVLGGAGGVGATTAAVALAEVAARDGRQSTLIDLDPLGGGIERIAAPGGPGGPDGAGWATLAASSGRFGSRSLREALPRRDGLAVVGWGSGPRWTPEEVVVREVLSGTSRGSDLVVVDLPRTLDAAARDLLTRVDDVLVVACTTTAAVAATSRLLALLLPVAARCHLLVRRTGASIGPYDVGEGLGVPVLAVLPHDRRLDEAVDLGLGPVPRPKGALARAARKALQALPPGPP